MWIISCIIIGIACIFLVIYALFLIGVILLITKGRSSEKKQVHLEKKKHKQGKNAARVQKLPRKVDEPKFCIRYVDESESPDREMPKKIKTSKEIHSSSDPVAQTTETKPKSSESSPSVSDEGGLTSTTSVTDDTRPESIQYRKETDSTETDDSLTACTPTEVQNQQQSGNVGGQPTITKAPKEEKTLLERCPMIKTSKEIHSSSDPVAQTTETKPKSSESSPSVSHEDGLTSTTSVTDDTRPESIQYRKEADSKETDDSLTACTPTEVQNQQTSGNVGGQPTITKALKLEKALLERCSMVQQQKLKLFLRYYVFTVARRMEYASLKAKSRGGSQTWSSPSAEELIKLRQKVKIILQVKQKLRNSVETINDKLTPISDMLNEAAASFRNFQGRMHCILDGNPDAVRDVQKNIDRQVVFQDRIMEFRDERSGSLNMFLAEYSSVREDLTLSNEIGLFSRVAVDGVKSGITKLLHVFDLLLHEFETSGGKPEFRAVGKALHEGIKEFEKKVFILEAILGSYEDALKGRELQDFKFNDTVQNRQKVIEAIKKAYYLQ